MQSKNYKHWISVVDDKRCIDCEEMHGKIYAIDENPISSPPLHYFCRCYIETMKAILAGKATDKGKDGADWWLKNTGDLPDYYITRQDAKKLGWKQKKGNLKEVAPGRMIKDNYKNKNGHLPSDDGRVWYEADLSFKNDYRGSDRIVFSNDGLIFVTYDHYKTFTEII